MTGLNSVEKAEYNRGYKSINIVSDSIGREYVVDVQTGKKIKRPSKKERQA